jgi:hypothetical protein
VQKVLTYRQKVLTYRQIYQEDEPKIANSQTNDKILDFECQILKETKT